MCSRFKLTVLRDGANRRHCNALLAALCFELLTTSAIAQPSNCVSETEPNDAPEQAAAAGTCITGTLSGEDSQDLWRWQVDSPETLWQLELDGLDAGLTSVELLRVTFDAQGRVQKSESINQFETRGASAKSQPLFLPAGEYFVGVAAAGADGDYTLRRRAVDLPDRTELESNDRPEQGEAVAGVFELRGSGDNDYFTWTLSESDARNRWDLSLRASLGQRFALRLYDEKGAQIQYRLDDLAGLRELRDLGLGAGEYRIRVEAIAAAAGATYTLAASATGERGDGFEEEPNEIKAANLISTADGVRGRLDEGPLATDYFRFDAADSVTDRSTLIRLQSDSAQSRKLCLQTESGREIQCREGTGLVELGNLDLHEKRYLLRAEGRSDMNGTYSLTFEDHGQFDKLAEREPNDLNWTAADLPDAGAAKGRLDGRDVDIFRFIAPGDAPALWRVQTVGDNVARLAVLDASGYAIVTANRDRTSERIRLSRLLLLPGTHFIAVSGEDSDYVLRVLPQGPPDPRIENEPNDTPATAMPLPFDFERRGLLTEGDNDHYRFRLFAREQVRLTVTPPGDGRVRVRFTPSLTLDENVKNVNGEPMTYEGWLLPGDYDVWVDAVSQSEDAYSIRLDRLNPFSGPVSLDPTLAIDVSLDSPQIAAYSTWQQRVSSNFAIINNGSTPRTLHIESSASHESISIETDIDTVVASPGETTLVAATLTVPPDMWEGTAVSIRVAAREGAELVATGSANLTPSSDTEPVTPTFAFRVPETLLGTVDMASIAMGARVVPAAGQRDADLEMQHNQFEADSSHRIAEFNARNNAFPLAFTVELGGDAPVPVVGLAVHPQGAAGTAVAAQQPREFEFQLSSDGQVFNTVVNDTLTTERIERFFPLPQSIDARYARLVVNSNHGDASRLVLDSWKVLATPDFLSEPVNLSNPDFGGHLVYQDLESTQTFDFRAPQSPLVSGSNRWQLNCSRECKASVFVVGFHEGRAAEVVGIEWQEMPLQGDNRQQRALVAVSAETPVGPWRSVGEIKMTGTEPGSQTLAFDTPVTARYVRFEMPEDGPFPTALPDVVRIFERPVESNYRSILGEWGWEEPLSSHEWRQPPDHPADDEDDSNNSISNAPLLTDRVAGTVRIGDDEDFFRVEIPANTNSIYLDVGGEPTVGVELELLDESGKRIALAANAEESAPTLQRWRASVEPGKSYWLRVHEPPRSVIFSWDTSGSVAPYRALIKQAVTRFAASVRPGQEAVNLLPFGAPRLLLDRWEDEPTLIWRALQDFQKDSDSSETGITLLRATEALATRRGSRAIVLIGDMALPLRDSADLWEALRIVQPHIYLLRIEHSGTNENTGLVMQHWAAVNAGDARDAPSVSEMDTGFARAAARLRQAARYTVSVSTKFVEPPGPGRLRVVSRLIENEESLEPTVLGNTAVEIILDASGSMQARLGGQRRIDIAKATLTELARSALPNGIPIALRVFGHVEGNYSCRTDLVRSLEPLNAAFMASTIEAIEPQNLAGTPIAASLRAVAEDLAEATGQKLVVLVTDGEETCDGDPAAEIARLRAAGTDVRLNIVGFAINDEALKAQFGEWAELGGGSYIDAANEKALNAAMSEAFRVPFRVIDGDGKDIASGIVNGDWISLPDGEYSVEVLSEPTTRHEQVIVLGEQDQTLAIGN